MAEQQSNSTPAPETAPPPSRDVGGGMHLDDVHLLDYAKVLHKRRWTAIPAFVAIV